MSRTGRFLGGVSLGYLNLVLLTLTGLWLTPFFLNRIGTHDYGLWLVGTQIITYLMLMDLGVVALLPRETAYAIGRAGNLERATDLPSLVGQIGRLVLWQVPFVALAASIAWFSLPTEWETLRGPLGVVMLAFVAMFPLRILPAVLQGMQDLAFLGYVQIFTLVVSTALTVGLVLRGFGLYALALGWVSGQVLAAGVYWYRLPRRFSDALLRHLPALSWPTARAHLSRGSWVNVAQVAQVMLNGTDLLIISYLLGPAAVVPFVLTGKLVAVLRNQPQVLLQASLPALSEMKAGESRRRILQACNAMTQAVLMLSGAVVCVILIINEGFVSWWVGADHYGGLALTTLLLLSMLLRHWKDTAVAALFAFGYERRISLTHLLDGLVTIGSSVIFVRLLGPIGAPLGSLLGVGLVSLPGNLSVLARETGGSPMTLLAPSWAWCQRFVLGVAVAAAIAKLSVPNGVLALVLTAVAAGTVYLALMLPVALRPPLGVYLRPRLALVRIKLFAALRSSHQA